MLKGLLFWGTLAGSGLQCLKDDIECMSEPAGSVNGYDLYHDRKGREVINGERVFRESRKDEYGNNHNVIVGTKTGRIYQDSFNKFYAKEKAIDDENYQKAIANNKSCYMRYDIRFKCRVPVEIKTGKVIAGIYRDKGENIYRKFYLTDNLRQKYSSTPMIFEGNEGDFGIPITEEEFDDINSTSWVVEDYLYKWCKWRDKIGTPDDPYKDVRFFK